MRWRQQIYDAEGEPCGRFKAAICNDELRLDECIRFTALPGGFERYRNHIALDTIWPMAVLMDIEVKREKRGRRLGRSALTNFYRQAAQKGAVLAIGRIGWPPTENWQVHRDRNLKIYRNAGWMSLPQQGVESYFIYRDLRNDA